MDDHTDTIEPQSGEAQRALLAYARMKGCNGKQLSIAAATLGWNVHQWRKRAVGVTEFTNLERLGMSATIAGLPMFDERWAKLDERAKVALAIAADEVRRCLTASE